MKNLKKEIELIKASGVFDSSYYLTEYPDVVQLGLDPVEHYLRLGAKLLRNPSGNFNTSEYLRKNPEIASAALNPLVHFVSNGPIEGQASLSGAATAVRTDVRAHLEKIGKTQIKGFLDRLDTNGLDGWAVDHSRPGKPVQLSMFVDGIYFMDIETSSLRNDVNAAGMRGERAGFAATWPTGLFRKGTTIEIKHRVYGVNLSRSPRSIDEQVGETDRQLKYLDAYRAKELLATTIIVPIFNAYEAVVECLDALDRQTASPVEILLINDRSTDPRIAGLLDTYSRRERYRVHHNPENLGYTRTVNKAIGMCVDRDVVLLNSDTVVTERWLENLRYCAYAKPRVATVTAFSDNAGAFSMPEIGTFNPVPESMTGDQYARVVTAAGAGRLLEVPTGNGFCMYIRRQVINEIGVFDEEKFPRGYGEENDFCMRALRRGWVNIVSDKAYVFHKRSQSFQGEKAALMDAGSKAVNAAYPEYRMLTQRFRDAEFSSVRHRARGALGEQGKHMPLQRVMYVISTQTGGTPQTNMDLMRAMKGKYECLLLRCDSKLITLSALVGDELMVRETHKLLRAIDPISHRSDEYDRVVLDMMYRYSVSLLHIRHIGWHSMGLAEAAKSIGVPVTYSAHDFYALCPSLNLLDENLKYCAGSCTPGEGTCQIALWPAASFPTLKHRFIGRWREMFGEFLTNCDALITTAPSAAEILLSAFPEVREKLTVIPHGREFSSFQASAAYPNPSEPVRVLVPGNISLSKGAQLIKEIAELDVEGRFEFHFLGEIWPGLAKIGVHHGKYDRASFSSIVDGIAPHVGVILSVWPETYCHTLTEMWSCGIPVFGFNIGAVGDRIDAAGAGWLLERGTSAKEIYQQMNQAISDGVNFKRKLEATHEWQRTEGKWNDTGTMAIGYRAIYQQLLVPGSKPRRRIGLVIKGGHSHPATAHIRVLRPFANPEVSSEVDARPVTTEWLLAGGIDQFDALLVQRDAVPAEHVEELIALADAGKVPYIFEIDDWLWNLPADHTDNSITEPQKRAMLMLARHAQVVTTSTPRLAKELEKFATNIEIIPNGLDEALWLRDLSSDFISEIGEKLGLANGKRALLYMGTKSHAADLALIAPAISSVRDAMRDLVILQIGGGTLLPGAIEIKVPKQFSQYPDFVNWFRAVCTFATVAIAPLRDDDFNAAKSDIKTLDYGLAGVPAVYSDVGPYAVSVLHNKTGLLSRNDTKSWVDSISKLLEDDGLRKQIKGAAFNEAQRRGLQKGAAVQWKQVLARIFCETASG